MRITNIKRSHQRQKVECGAGQAIVQLAISSVNRLEYAIKFFLSRSAFEQERYLYSGSNPLGQFLPKVLQPQHNLLNCHVQQEVAASYSA